MKHLAAAFVSGIIMGMAIGILITLSIQVAADQRFAEDRAVIEMFSGYQHTAGR